MPAPEGTPDEMYRLMRRCWEYEPERRPHFDEICRLLDVMIKDIKDPWKFADNLKEK